MPTTAQWLVFFYWFVCIKEAGCSRTKLTALAGSMVSNGRHIIIGGVGEYCAPSSPRSALNGKRPRPTALFPLHKAQAGQVALAPNPALPKDQPLRGSQHKTNHNSTVTINFLTWSSSPKNQPPHGSQCNSNLNSPMTINGLTWTWPSKNKKLRGS